MSKFKSIFTRVHLPNDVKEQLETVFSQYQRDDGDTLRALITRTHAVLCKNTSIASIPTDVSNRPSQRIAVKADAGMPRSSQELLGDIFETLDTLLIDTLANPSNVELFDQLKSDLRELFTKLLKKISTTESEVETLKARVSRLELTQSDVNDIRMGNVANRLRNKFIRYIKPNLSRRDARYERIQDFQCDDKFVDLNQLIQSDDPTMKLLDVARSIKVLGNHRATKAHDEAPMSVEEIEELLASYISSNDKYLGEQATVVVHYLKIMAQNMHEPLIVNLQSCLPRNMPEHAFFCLIFCVQSFSSWRWIFFFSCQTFSFVNKVRALVESTKLNDNRSY